MKHRGLLKRFSVTDVPPKAGLSLTGFTLVEVLIVAAILPFISFALYTTFSNGVEIRNRMNEQSKEEDLSIFFDKFTTSLRNSFGFSGLTFSGKEDVLIFTTFINSKTLNKKTVGEMIYNYDALRGVVIREERDFTQIYEQRPGVITQPLSNIESLKFSYYFYDKEMAEYVWQDEWKNEQLPLAVRIKLAFKDDLQKNEFIRTVRIPVGG